MIIDIESRSGFCFGVARAVELAELALQQDGQLCSLGQIVHNEQELNRLKEKGLHQVSHGQLGALSGKRVLIRAHGEPPETYRIIRDKGIELIDATCPVVLKLQKRVKQAFEEQPGAQIVIYGKPAHPEVTGLSGQTRHQAIVVNDDPASLEHIDFSKPVVLFCQTTQSLEGFHDLKKNLAQRMEILGLDPEKQLTAHDTICRQVSRRGPAIKKFAQSHDVVIFVSGANSSNGRYLFGICREANPRAHMISNEYELKPEWFEKARSAGVSGATSTPLWQLEKVAGAIRKLNL